MISEIGVEMYNTLLIYFLSIGIFLTNPVLHRDNAMYLASYFIPLEFSEVGKFNLLTSNGIAKDIPAERDKKTEGNKDLMFAPISRMEFTERFLLHHASNRCS